MTKRLTHSEAYPREFKVDRSGSYNRVVVYGKYVNPPKAIDAIMELNTLDEVRQIRDLLTAVLEEGIEPDQPPAVDSYFNKSEDALTYKRAPERAVDTGLFEANEPEKKPAKSKNKKTNKAPDPEMPEQPDMFPEV